VIDYIANLYIIDNCFCD